MNKLLAPILAMILVAGCTTTQQTQTIDTTSVNQDIDNIDQQFQGLETIIEEIQGTQEIDSTDVFDNQSIFEDLI